MNTYHFTQNLAEYDDSLRYIKRVLIPIIVAGFFVTVFIFPLDMFQIPSPISMVTIVSVLYAIIFIPVVVGFFRNFNKSRGASIEISDKSILQMTP